MRMLSWICRGLVSVFTINMIVSWCMIESYDYTINTAVQYQGKFVDAVCECDIKTPTKPKQEIKRFGSKTKAANKKQTPSIKLTIGWRHIVNHQLFNNVSEHSSRKRVVSPEPKCLIRKIMELLNYY